MCIAVKLLLGLLTVVVAQQRQVTQSSEGSCLLAKKKVMGKISLVQEDSMTSEEVGLMRKDWRIRHSALEKRMNRSQDILDKFIKAQGESSDHCSSRLMESKRILDGIVADVHSINSQVKSQEAVLETETENLKISKLSINAVETEYEKSIKICKEERREAEGELKKYSAELDELHQIANPSVRAEISHSVTVEKSEQSLSLVDFHLDKEMCKSFVNLAQRHEHRRLIDGPEQKDCDKQREELQEAFEKAVKETRELKEAARKRSVDETCFETADTIKASELVPLVAQRDAAVEKIESASQALAALEPVLNLVKEKAEKLRIHITQTLTPECEEAGEASKLLVEVRKLIISLEECPGRNDFKLKIPPVETENPEATPEENVEFPEEQSPEKTEEYIKKAKAEDPTPGKPKESNNNQNNFNSNGNDNDEGNLDSMQSGRDEGAKEATNEMSEEEAEKAGGNEVPKEVAADMTKEEAEKAGGNEVPTEVAADMTKEEAEEAGGNEVPTEVAADMTKDEAEKAGGNEVPKE